MASLAIGNLSLERSFDRKMYSMPPLSTPTLHNNNSGIVPPWLERQKNPGIVPPWMQTPITTLPVTQGAPVGNAATSTAFVNHPASDSPTTLVDALRSR